MKDGRAVAVRSKRVPPSNDGGQLCLLDVVNDAATPEERIECDAVVNTIPLPHLMTLMGDAVSPDAKQAADVLRFRALTIVGLRVKRPKALPAQSIYFQDKTFNRLSETRNYVPQVLDVYARLKEKFEKGTEIQFENMHRDARREGKTLAGPISAGTAAARDAQRPVERPEPPAASAPRRR